MIQIRIDDEPLDLTPGFSVEMEDTSPIYNERGSQSVPASVPATPRNERLLGFPTRLDTGTDPRNPARVAVVSDGAYMRRGVVNITAAGRDEGITLNVGFDNSTAYAEWSKKKLADLTELPLVTASVDTLRRSLLHYYSNGTGPLAVFPVAVAKDSITENEVETTYWTTLNGPSMGSSTKVENIIDGKLTEVTVPPGYGVAPFVRVWRLLELVFADMGMTIVNNIFYEDTALRRPVVLNNAADVICPGRIDYADLMPDCTVSELMNALWVRFGLVYSVNYDTRTADLRLMRDILADGPSREMLPMTSGCGTITYETPKYIKLAAKTSLDGAAPATERFEDFVKGLETATLKLGSDVASWSVKDADRNDWDGDVRDDYWNDDYDPDRDDRDDYEDRDDRDDDDRERAAAPKSDTRSASFLAREFETGLWYKLDATNNAVRESSSGFFNWDPQTPDMEAMDLTSEDECVPMVKVGTELMPAYLTGARHYHSYIKGSDADSEQGASTPLAFIQAFTADGVTVGRLTSEDRYGTIRHDGDRQAEPLSLFFQFKDGLFAKFWAGYDEILRHGNRTVEVPAVMHKSELRSMDMLKPVTLRGIRCLFDSVSYSLPAGHMVTATVKLRSITTRGRYDITREQNIPEFAIAARHLEWRPESTTLHPQSMLEDEANRKTAVEKYRTESGYTEHGTEGDWWLLLPKSAVPQGWKPDDISYKTDPNLEDPAYAGQRKRKIYTVYLTYAIHEVHDTSTQGQEGEEPWMLSPAVIGVVEISVPYDVHLIAKWIYD